MERIAVFVYYDKDGLLSDSALFYLRALESVAHKIILVVNGALKTSEIEKFSNPDVKIIERKNSGWDFGGYKAGVLFAAENLSEYDELILANSSVFGPFVPFNNFFEKVKPADFWGITRGFATKKIKEHIQTYFLVFKKNTFGEVLNYFKKMKLPKDKKGAIKLEIGLTEYFTKKGFKFETLIADEISKFKVQNPGQYLSGELLENYSMPFIKKTAFGVRYDLAKRETGGGETKKAFEFLKNRGVDCEFITREISRIYPMEEIQRFIGLNFSINENSKARSNASFGAIVGRDIINNARFSQFEQLAEFKNILPQLKNLAKKSEYILVFNPKTDDKKYFKFLLDCVLFDTEYPLAVAEIFQKKPHVGVLTPIPYLFNGFEPFKNQIGRLDIKDFFTKTGISLNINVDFMNTIPAAFWIRKEAVLKIQAGLEFQTKLNSGMIFSVLAQNAGFLTGTIAPKSIMESAYGDLVYWGLKRELLLDKLSVKFKRLTGKIR